MKTYTATATTMKNTESYLMTVTANTAEEAHKIALEKVLAVPQWWNQYRHTMNGYPNITITEG
jgi:hypothetical protein